MDLPLVVAFLCGFFCAAGVLAIGDLLDARSHIPDR